MVSLQFVDLLLHLRDPRKLRLKFPPDVFHKVTTGVAHFTANFVELRTGNRFLSWLQGTLRASIGSVLTKILPHRETVSHFRASAASHFGHIRTVKAAANLRARL